MIHCFHNKLVSFWVQNPFSTWWKARKYFKFPKLSIRFFMRDPGFQWYMFHPHKSDNNIAWLIDVDCQDVCWKDKYGVRHEQSPYFYVALFNLFGIYITTTASYRDELNEKRECDEVYWEYLLSYLYEEKAKKKLSYIEVSQYQSRLFQSKWIIEPVTLISLNKNGFKKLKKELDEDEEL